MRLAWERSLAINSGLATKPAWPAATVSSASWRERGGQTASAITWHIKALDIRLRLEVPEAAIGLHSLGEYYRELGTGPFTSIAEHSDLVPTVTSLLDHLDKNGSDTN